MENSNNQGRRFGKSISHHNIQNMAMRYSEKNFPILISGKNDCVTSTIQTCISVTNLPLSASEKDIWAMFGPFGAVTYVSIVPDITDPASKGTATATVSMPIYDEAIFAIRTLNQNGAKVLYLEFSKILRFFTHFHTFFSLKITNSVSRSKFLHQPSPTR